MPRTETSGSELSSQVLSLGSFLGLRRWGACLECWWKGEVLESVLPFLTAPTPHWAQPPSFTNPTGRGQDSLEFVRKQHKPLTLLPSLFSASSSLDLVWGDQLLPEVPRPTDIAEPNPQDQGGSCKRWHYSSGSYGQSFRRSPHPQPLSVQIWQGSGAGRLGSSCLFSGQAFLIFTSLAFLVLKVRVKIATSKVDDEVSRKYCRKSARTQKARPGAAPEFPPRSARVGRRARWFISALPAPGHIQILFRRNQRSNCQHLLDHGKSKRVPEKHPFLLY